MESNLNYKLVREEIAKIYGVPVDFLVGGVFVDSKKLSKSEKLFIKYHSKILRRMKKIFNQSKKINQIIKEYEDEKR